MRKREHLSKYAANAMDTEAILSLNTPTDNLTMAAGSDKVGESGSPFVARSGC
jgi:hypothetical protein